MRQRFRALFDEALGRLIAPGLLIYNPLAETVDELRDRARQRSRADGLAGCRVDELEEFAKGTSHGFALESVSITTPGLGERTFTLFDPGDHARVDALIGFPRRRRAGLRPDPLRAAREHHHAREAAAARRTDARPRAGRRAGRARAARGRRLGADLQRARGRRARERDGPRAHRPAVAALHHFRSLLARRPARQRTSSTSTTCAAARASSRCGGSCVLRPAFRVLFTDWENALQSFRTWATTPWPTQPATPRPRRSRSRSRAAPSTTAQPSSASAAPTGSAYAPMTSPASLRSTWRCAGACARATRSRESSSRSRPRRSSRSKDPTASM